MPQRLSILVIAIALAILQWEVIHALQVAQPVKRLHPSILTSAMDREPVHLAGRYAPSCSALPENTIFPFFQGIEMAQRLCCCTTYTGQQCCNYASQCGGIVPGCPCRQ